MNIKDGKTVITGINSSNVHSLEYNYETKELIATLKTGKYSYKNVDKQVFLLIEAAYINQDSVGREFNRLIVKGGYEYEKL